MLYYSPASHQINLLNDAASAWATATTGTSSTLQNNQCSLNVAGTSATLSGSTLVLNLPITFKPSFSGTKNIYIYAADVSGTNSGWQQRGTWTVPSIGVVSQVQSDFTGDGHPDIVWQDPVSGASEVFYLGGAQGITLLGTGSITSHNPWHIVAMADFNGDGRTDLVWQDPNTGQSQIWLMGGAQGTTLLSAASLASTNSWRIVAEGDFNKDGHPDLVWQDPATGHAQIWFLGGAQGTTLTGAANLTTSNSWRIVGASDFNGDGHPDLLWQDPATGATQAWYLGGAQGNVVTSAAQLTGASSWRIVAQADFNLDGHTDVVWQDPGSGQSQVWFLGGAQGTTMLGASPLTGANSWRIVGPR
jgi:FG-GAP-like repeat